VTAWTAWRPVSPNNRKLLPSSRACGDGGELRSWRVACAVRSSPSSGGQTPPARGVFRAAIERLSSAASVSIRPVGACTACAFWLPAQRRPVRRPSTSRGPSRRSMRLAFDVARSVAAVDAPGVWHREVRRGGRCGSRLTSRGPSRWSMRWSLASQDSRPSMRLAFGVARSVASVDALAFGVAGASPRRRGGARSRGTCHRGRPDGDRRRVR
jgi:hypothetical protein